MRGQVSVVVRARIGDGIRTSPDREPTGDRTSPSPSPERWPFWAWDCPPPSAWGSALVLGLWADSAWHTAPVLLVVGLVLGLAAAAASVVAQIRKYL